MNERYVAIMTALESFYEQTNEPEALGLSKALSRKSTVIAMYLLDFVLPQVAKFSLDDTLLPAANWVLELLDARDELQTTTKIKINSESITSFKKNVAKPFVTD